MGIIKRYEGMGCLWDWAERICRDLAVKKEGLEWENEGR